MSKPIESVKVAVRIRPLLEKEIKKREKNCVRNSSSETALELYKEDNKNSYSKRYTFDTVFRENSTQDEIFKFALPIVNSAIDGYNATIFAYGQTGSGKTFTMEGDHKNRENMGIMPRTFKYIFDAINSVKGREFLVACTYFEIHNEKARDLLSASGKEIEYLDVKQNKDGSFYLKGSTSPIVKSASEMMSLLRKGSQKRVVAETAMNQASSRSHSMYQITVESRENGPNSKLRKGKLNLVDLAGSERLAKTGLGNNEERQKEGISINYALTCLGNVIAAVVEAQRKNITVPIRYRDSKLTKMLKDSLGGNAKTLLIANCGPAASNFFESKSTLWFASRVKTIKNKPTVNMNPKDALMLKYQEEIKKLQSQLEEIASKNGNDVHNKLLSEIERAKKEKSDVNELFLKEKEKRMALEGKLNVLKGGLIVGGNAPHQLNRDLEVYREVLEKNGVEEQNRHKLLQMEEEKLSANSFSSLQEEIKLKSRRIKELHTQLDDIEDELNDSRSYYADVVNRLNKDIKLKRKIIEYFIPKEIARNLERDEYTWNEEKEDWNLKNDNRDPVFEIDSPIANPLLTGRELSIQSMIDRGNPVFSNEFIIKPKDVPAEEADGVFGLKMKQSRSETVHDNLNAMLGEVITELDNA